MQANELMIGNWIADRGGKQWQINHWEGINKVASKPNTTMCMGVMTETHPLTEYVDYLKPIPLSEGWLSKAGFERIEREDIFECFVYPYWVKEGVILLYNPHNGSNDYKIGYAEMRCGKYHATLCKWIDNVHSLQNFYFTNTGKELEFSDHDTKEETTN